MILGILSETRMPEVFVFFWEMRVGITYMNMHTVHGTRTKENKVKKTETPISRYVHIHMHAYIHITHKNTPQSNKEEASDGVSESSSSPLKQQPNAATPKTNSKKEAFGRPTPIQALKDESSALRCVCVCVCVSTMEIQHTQDRCTCNEVDQSQLSKL